MKQWTADSNLRLILTIQQFYIVDQQNLKLRTVMKIC